ncbi:hypothetical protein AWR36_000330 [Microbulbifer flavimaris]|uniref:Uncharacterized protein n=1 Tax=Microbulbifer flavimaris TaxID=1781068 RepID=A0ABX4I419_9GAMM|nr:MULTISPECIES: DUF6512 family protein [Microbulbifer]KUJ84200.1 hypothetical protein AVO43_00335 [Microbulbifer sp. ZGT114]PCO06274.1 hypothetical protein AWR36_000330 [Microbulbifer flavimaris]
MKQTHSASMGPAKSRKQLILAWELLGAVWILITGSLLHFTFEWSGNSRAVAALVPVNESVWEHLKLVFWPGLAFSLMEYRYLAKQTRDFVTAKCLGLCIMPAAIVLLFYTYTSILGTNDLTLDILTFVAAIVAGQFVSYRFLLHPSPAGFWKLSSRAGVIFFLLAFPLFTFFPPHIFLFEHAGGGIYGIHAAATH